MTETTESTNRRTLYGFIRDRLAEEESTGGDPKWIEVHRTMNRYGGLAVASADEAPDDADYVNGAAVAWEIALQMLASRWSGHPDYREEWSEAGAAEDAATMPEFWVGHDDDLQAVLNQAPDYSVFHIVNNRPGGIRIDRGHGMFVGCSQEEYDAHKAAGANS